MSAIDVRATALRLGVSPQTVRRMISRGELAAFRVGPKLIRLDSDEVDRLVHRMPSTGGVA
jgi:excisionase family DNA binding protein